MIDKETETYFEENKDAAQELFSYVVSCTHPDWAYVINTPEPVREGEQLIIDLC